MVLRHEALLLLSRKIRMPTSSRVTDLTIYAYAEFVRPSRLVATVRAEPFDFPCNLFHNFCKLLCRGGEIGKHAGFRTQWGNP